MPRVKYMECPECGSAATFRENNRWHCRRCGLKAITFAKTAAASLRRHIGDDGRPREKIMGGTGVRIAPIFEEGDDA